MTLAEAAANVGERVAYLDRHARSCEACDEPDEGVIASVGARFVFVRYGSDPNARATAPEDLTLPGGEPA